VSFSFCSKLYKNTVYHSTKRSETTSFDKCIFFYDNQELNHIKTGAIIDALTLLAIIPFLWTCLILIFFYPTAKKKVKVIYQLK